MEETHTLYQNAIELFRKGELQEAIVQLEEALRLDWDFPDALEALGVLYSKVDRLDDAIEAMKRLAKISPNHVMAHANLSRFYVQKGMILEAEQEQAEARRLSWKAELKAERSVSSKAAERSSEADAEDEKRDLESRISRYQKVIQLDPKDVLGYFSLGTAYLEGKRLEEARKAFEQAIQVDPQHSPSYFNLGVTLESLKEPSKAVEVYRKGIKVAEDRGDIIPLRKMEARLRACSSIG